MILKDCFYKRSLFVSFPSSKGNQIKIGLRSFPATWKKTLIWRWHCVKCCVRRDVSRVRYNGRSLNQLKPRTCLETQSNRTLLVRFCFARVQQILFQGHTKTAILLFGHFSKLMNFVSKNTDSFSYFFFLSLFYLHSVISASVISNMPFIATFQRLRNRHIFIGSLSETSHYL